MCLFYIVKESNGMERQFNQGQSKQVLWVYRVPTGQALMSMDSSFLRQYHRLSWIYAA